MTRIYASQRGNISKPRTETRAAVCGGSTDLFCAQLLRCTPELLGVSVYEWARAVTHLLHGLSKGKRRSAITPMHSCACKEPNPLVDASVDVCTLTESPAPSANKMVSVKGICATPSRLFVSIWDLPTSTRRDFVGQPSSRAGQFVRILIAPWKSTTLRPVQIVIPREVRD